MGIIEEVSGRVAVVRSFDPDLERVTVEYRNGDTGWFTRPPMLDFEVGTVWLIGDGTITPADDDLWPNRSTFAVVGAVLDNSLVIDDHGRLRSLMVDDPVPRVTDRIVGEELVRHGWEIKYRRSPRQRGYDLRVVRGEADIDEAQIARHRSDVIVEYGLPPAPAPSGPAVAPTDAKSQAAVHWYLEAEVIALYW